MQSPPQLTFRDVTPSPAVEAHVAQRAAKLDTIFDRITSCHVAIEAPKRHVPGTNKRYHVRIDLTLPGKHLCVGHHDPGDSNIGDVYVAIDDAFDDAERLLRDHKEVMQGRVKRHEGPPHGRVVRLFPAEGYGFIEAEDGREVYFHKNSVLHRKFDDLSVGTAVWFAEEDGDKGPQASTVHVH